MNSTVFRPRGKGSPLICWLALVVLALVVLSLVMLSLGCDAADEQASARQEKTAPSVAKSEQVPEKPQRIVSLAPNVTEILFAIGAGERIVGVTRFCDFPSRAKEIPKVGGIVDVDLEAILAKRPDLVVGTSSGADPEIADKLDEAGVSYGFVRMDNLAETYRGIRKIGELVGSPKEGEELAKTMEADIAQVSQASSEGEAPRVLMVFGRNPLIAAGPGTFGHELVEIAGGKNVMADAKTSYPKLDIEKVISLDPARIIDATMAGEGLDTEFWTQYSSIDAVEEGHVYLIDDPVVLRPAPRLVEGLQTIREAVDGRKKPDDPSAHK